MHAHTLKEWIATTRYWSFSVSAMPAIATIALLCTNHFDINWTNALLAIVGVVVFHAAGNLLSDVGDYRSGADSDEAYAIPQLVKHQFSQTEYLILSGILFLIGIAIGIFLFFRTGWPLLVIGVLGFMLTVLYTQSKNVYLSDLCVFLIFGVLILLGTSYVAVGRMCYESLTLTIPLGFITLSVLHANNTVDIETDGKAGLHTLAMALGFNASVKVYIVYQVIPFVFVLGGVIAGLLPWSSLLCLVALIPALSNIKKAAQYKTQGRDAVIGLDLMSAKLQLIFSLSLSIGLFLALCF